MRLSHRKKRAQKQGITLAVWNARQSRKRIAAERRLRWSVRQRAISVRRFQFLTGGPVSRSSSVIAHLSNEPIVDANLVHRDKAKTTSGLALDEIWDRANSPEMSLAEKRKESFSARPVVTVTNESVGNADGVFGMIAAAVARAGMSFRSRFFTKTSKKRNCDVS
ncbi:hypothetical protein ABMX64_20130 [Vibrio vulnificus]|uniref:hypothetical protein n=2 Tax=Vibrio vulnificus TaxID=672 RepID=UPI0024DFF7E0|nr:hypothetical protein [Vibrio vulnificus]MDK2679240.1 hypothetical protein [Vibrio vulnificus]MDK2688031.1 hypothetical protein [Vibrio vulnificus]